MVVGMGLLWQRRRRAAGDGAEVTGRERSKWDQRAVLGWIDSKSQWTDKPFNSVVSDQIGRIDDKKFQQ